MARKHESERKQRNNENKEITCKITLMRQSQMREQHDEIVIFVNKCMFRSNIFLLFHISQYFSYISRCSFKWLKMQELGKARCSQLHSTLIFQEVFKYMRKKFHPKCYQAGLPLGFLTFYVEFVSFVSHCLSGVPLNSA